MDLAPEPHRSAGPGRTPHPDRRASCRTGSLVDQRKVPLQSKAPLAKPDSGRLRVDCMGRNAVGKKGSNGRLKCEIFSRFETEDVDPPASL